MEHEKVIAQVKHYRRLFEECEAKVQQLVLAHEVAMRELEGLAQLKARMEKLLLEQATLQAEFERSKAEFAKFREQAVIMGTRMQALVKEFVSRVHRFCQSEAQSYLFCLPMTEPNAMANNLLIILANRFDPDSSLAHAVVPFDVIRLLLFHYNSFCVEEGEKDLNLLGLGLSMPTLEWKPKK